MKSKILLYSILSSSLLLGACSDGSGSNSNSNSNSNLADQLPVYDFSEVDQRLQKFVEESAVLDGISITLVDKIQGTVHEASFGDHSPDIVLLLASVSKFPSATLLMAIHEDSSIDFDVDMPIGNYLTWDGVYGDRTTTQLLSNTSGIPGIYGDIELHECQYDPDVIFEDCARLIYSTELPGTQPAGTIFDYGSSQWHLAGAVATQVTNSEFNQAFDRYIAQPCGLQVYETGNTKENPEQFTGHPDSLTGRSNPLLGGGAISNMQDMAKLLLLHLREGVCENNRVLSPEAVSFMQVDRKTGLVTLSPAWETHKYGMGWWGRPELPDVIYDSGAFGSVAWIDTKRMIGGFVAVEDYAREGGFFQSWRLVLDEIIPLIKELVDDARQEVTQ